MTLRETTDLEKIKNRRKQNLAMEDEATTCNWIKKLNDATRMVNIKA